MKKLFALIVTIGLAWAPAAYADKKKDCEFLEDAAEASLLWSVIGSLAQTNSTNFALPPGELSQTNATNILIIELANALATNHALLYSNAYVLQQSNRCDLSTEVDSDDRKTLRKLSRLTGERFDRAFLEFVIEETCEAIEDYKEAALEAKSPAVRALARQGLLILTQQFVSALEAGEAVLGGDFDDFDD